MTRHSQHNQKTHEKRQRKRELQDVELNEGMEEKCNPGNRYRKRVEPVLLGRLDLRSRKDVFTERKGKVQIEKGVRKREKREYKSNTRFARPVVKVLL